MTTRELGRAALVAVVGDAIRAPSVHNTQPWRFRVTDRAIEVYADHARQLSVADPDGRALRLSCGAAIFNLRLALHNLGFAPAVHIVGTEELLAVVEADGQRDPTPLESALYHAIPRRHSNRYPFQDTAVPLHVRSSLIESARAESCWLDLILGPVGVETAAQLVRAADRMLVSNPAYTAEIAAWTRTDAGSFDGVHRRAGGPAPEPQDLLARRDFGGDARAAGHDYELEPLLGVFGAPSDSPWDDLTAGQGLQRVLLTATTLGLSSSLISQPIEVAQVREELRLGLRRYGSPHMLLRFGYAAPAPATARRPLAEVLLPSPSPAYSHRP